MYTFCHFFRSLLVSYCPVAALWRPLMAFTIFLLCWAFSNTLTSRRLQAHSHLSGMQLGLVRKAIGNRQYVYKYICIYIH